jgi:hypothetical protein
MKISNLGKVRDLALCQEIAGILAQGMKSVKISQKCPKYRQYIPNNQ